MADDGTFIKSADIAALLPTQAGTTAKSVAVTDVYVKNVEAWVMVTSLTDWTAGFAAADATMKPLLTLCGAAMCGMIVMNADDTGFTSRGYETAFDFLNTIFTETLKAITEKDGKAAIEDGL